MNGRGVGDEALCGLDEVQRKQRVADFFERFAWDGRALDPKAMSALEFLDEVLAEPPPPRGASA